MKEICIHCKRTFSLVVVYFMEIRTACSVFFCSFDSKVTSIARIGVGSPIGYVNHNTCQGTKFDSQSFIYFCSDNRVFKGRCLSLLKDFCNSTNNFLSKLELYEAVRAYFQPYYKVIVFL